MLFTKCVQVHVQTYDNNIKNCAHSFNYMIVVKKLIFTYRIYIVHAYHSTWNKGSWGPDPPPPWKIWTTLGLWHTLRSYATFVPNIRFYFFPGIKKGLDQKNWKCHVEEDDDVPWPWSNMTSVQGHDTLRSYTTFCTKQQLLIYFLLKVIDRKQN